MKILLLVISTFLSITCLGQITDEKQSSKNTVFGEFSIGNDINVYSVLYDRLIKPEGSVLIGLQTGISILSDGSESDRYYTFLKPVKCYFLFGKDLLFFETGLGIGILEIPFLDINAGIRLKSVSHGLCFRGGYNGFVIVPMGGGIINMLSISAGYSF